MTDYSNTEKGEYIDEENPSKYPFDRDPSDQRERYPIFVFGFPQPEAPQLFGRITHENSIFIKRKVTEYLLEKKVGGINGLWNTDLFFQKTRTISSIANFIERYQLKHIVVAQIENSPKEVKEISKIRDHFKDDVDVITAFFNISRQKNFDKTFTCPIFMKIDKDKEENSSGN